MMPRRSKREEVLVFNDQEGFIMNVIKMKPMLPGS